MLKLQDVNSPSSRLSSKRNPIIPIEIRVADSAKERMAFVKMPWRLYEGDPRWVPPVIFDQKRFLDPAVGPFYEHGDAKLFVAYQDGEPVGRISAHINHRHDEVYGKEKGFFGFFECVDDDEVAGELFKVAEDYLRSHGKTEAEGPYCFSIYDEIGIQINSFDTEPYILTMHNKPYYGDLVSKAGYSKSIDWYAYRTLVADCSTPLLKKYKRVRERILSEGNVTLRSVDNGRGFARDAAIVKEIFKEAWDRNWGHVPLSDREFDRIAEFIKLVVVPELSLIAEVDGEPVGCSLVIYDVNPTVRQLNGKLFPFGYFKLLRGIKKANRCRLILMGMLEEYRGKGYDLGFYTHFAEHAAEMGMVETEFSVIVETNDPLRNVLSKLPAVENYKTYRIYKKQL